MSKIQPLADRVLVKPMAAEEKTVGGIIIPDSAKAGGMYLDFAGNIKKFDSVQRKICFTDKTEIFLDDIIEIKSEILPENTVNL